MVKICKLCGKEFEAKGRQSICKRVHYNKCTICGRLFEVNAKTYTRKTCSKECNIQSNRIGALQNKKNVPRTNETSKGRYTKICILCGEEFHTDSKFRTTCYKEHVVKCPICGSDYTVSSDSYYKLTCSYACAAEFRARNEEARNGVRSSLQRPDVIDKIKKKNLEKYGVENPLSSFEIREQIKETNLQKYGAEYYTQSDDFKVKSQKTCIEKYGVPVAVQSEVVQKQIQETMLRKYGTSNIFSSDEFKQSMKKLNQERYGVDYYVQSEDFKTKQTDTWAKLYGGNPWSISEIRTKCNETNLERYGDIWPQRTEEVKQKQLHTFIQNRANEIQNEDARNNYLEYKTNPQKYIREHSAIGMSIEAIAKELGYADGTVLYNYIHTHGMEDVLRWSGISKMEQDMIDFILSLDSNIEIKLHDRTQISPKEIDIYLPEYRIGIECNPTITHNSTFVLGNVLGAVDYPVTPVDYHQMKTQMCEDKGIFLFHIFGYEWKNYKPVILSMLQNLLSVNTTRYYARKLQVKEVPSNVAVEFLKSNHRQGSANSSIRLGLYDGDMLVSLMTFGPARGTLGKRQTDDRNTIELIRFCNLRNTSVVGGASKLFKYFLHHYNPSKVISFSDRAHTRGKLYEILGFTKIHESAPGYVWVNLSSDLYFTRVACQKKNLPKLLDEPGLDIDSQTEQQIMSTRGFVQVFDSGTIRWEYTCTNR